MSLADLRKVLKENELNHYEVFPKERKILLHFENGHTLSVELEDHPGVHYEWDESMVMKVDGILIAQA